MFVLILKHDQCTNKFIIKFYLLFIYILFIDKFKFIIEIDY